MCVCVGGWVGGGGGGTSIGLFGWVGGFTFVSGDARGMVVGPGLDPAAVHHVFDAGDGH